MHNRAILTDKRSARREEVWPAGWPEGEVRWGEDGVDTRACESVEERAVKEVTASQFVLQFGYQCRVEIYAQLMVAPNKGADVGRLVYKVTSLP